MSFPPIGSNPGTLPPVNPAGEPAVPDVPTNENVLQELQEDFDRIARQKSRPTGGVEGSTMLNLCFLNDEQYAVFQKNTLSLEARDEKDKNRLYLTFNLIAPRVQKLMGRLSAFNAPFKAQPNRKDPQAIEDAEVVDTLIIATDEKLDEPSRMRERLFWLLVGGTAFEHVPWIPNATIEPMPQFQGQELLFKTGPKGQEEIVPQSVMQAMVQQGTAPEAFEIYEEVETVGEVGSEILGPFNVFLDQTVRSVSDLAPDQWVHVAQIKTIGWFKDNYNDDIQPAKEITLVKSRINADSAEASGGVYLKDLIPLVQGSVDDSDPKMALHIQSYQPPSAQRPHGRYVCWVPKQKVLHDDALPYENSEIPLVDFHFTPATTTFWTKAYITPLIAPQRFINRRMSQLGEQSNAAIYSNLLLGSGIKSSDIPSDYPGVIENGLADSGMPNVARLPPPEMPAWFLQSIQTCVQFFNDVAGGVDLMEDNKFPGQLRGPNAVPMLQEILDTQWGPLFNHLGERLARVKQFRLNRIKQFYPPIRTMHYTDRTQKDEVLTFMTEKILRSGTNFNITVQRGSLLPELRSLREARVRERLQSPLAVLYMDERTGRLDKSKIAADLQFGDAAREARESKYRKLAQELIAMIWKVQPVPPVQPFWDHKSMLDELEDAMATTEFLKASQQVQALFADRWSRHSAFLQQEAQAQQQSLQNHMIQGAVAQATQQAAAMAAAQEVKEAREQTHAQSEQPTQQYVAAAEARTQGQPRPQMPPRPQGPVQGPIHSVPGPNGGGVGSQVHP